MSQSVPKGVIEAVEALPKGTPISAKELLHLGQRAAVDQALFRLFKSGQLARPARGVYVCPAAGRFGPRVPSASELVSKIAETRGEIVTESGAVAANSLGLTEQVPIREIYLTSGRNRKLQIGRQTVEFRHASPWKLMLPGRPAGEALRAMAWLGPSRAHEALPALKKSLPPPEIAAIVAARSKVPTWMAKELSELVAA